MSYADAVTDRTAPVLRAATVQALHDNGMRQIARQISGEIAEMPTMADAVEQMPTLARHPDAV